MKKSLFVLGVAVAALASCTNEETVQVSQGLTIGFSGTGVDNVTKADITSADFHQFLVYGGYGAGEVVFNGREVNKSGGDWSYTPIEYWQLGETYNFGAYAPKVDKDGVVTATWNHESGLKLDVTSDATNQNDVVYAGKDGVTYSDAGGVQTVSLQFGHLLSKLQFKLVKDGQSLSTNQVVTVSNFKVASITTQGTWTKGVQGTVQTPLTGDFSDFTDETVDDAEGLSTDAWYVIPQEVSAFAITANVKVTDVHGSVIKEGTISASVPTSGAITEWESGNHYLYTAKLTMDNIDDPDTPDEDVKPIKFSGDVTAWSPATSSGDVTFN